MSINKYKQQTIDISEDNRKIIYLSSRKTPSFMSEI